MGPRSDERGNDLMRAQAITAKSLQWGRAPMSAEMIAWEGHGTPLPELQWGRAPMSAEIGDKGVELENSISASMGPRSDERGNAVHATVALHAPMNASMGPRSDERGNSAARASTPSWKPGFNGAALR